MKPILGAVLAIALSSPALAQAQYAPPPRAPAQGAQPVAAPVEPPVHFVGTFGADFGSTKLISVIMSDGSERSLKANQGVNGSLGIAFLKLGGGKFVTQATLGLEYSAVTASNGSIRWLAFPLEVMEFAYLDPVRFGVGISYLLAPSVKGEDFLDAYDVDFKSSPGLVLQGDWVWRLKNNARGARMTFGARYVVQQVESKETGASIDANAFGLVLGFTG